MSTACGANGAFGILLSDVKGPALGAIRKKLERIEEKYLEDVEADSPASMPAVRRLLKPLRDALSAVGIVVPDGARLLWTGSDDDRPASCDTDAEQWILGFGLFTRPDKYPPMSQSFIKASRWHTWVWMG